MAQFILRLIPDELWRRVKARAATEHPPGERFNLEGKMIQFLEVYARLGLAEMLRRCGETSGPSVSSSAGAPPRGRVPADVPPADR